MLSQSKLSLSADNEKQVPIWKVPLGNLSISWASMYNVGLIMYFIFDTNKLFQHIKHQIFYSNIQNTRKVIPTFTKLSLSADNEKQVPIWNVLLAQTKV
jgi:hypothetical protein